ncbi:phytanoyl- dioxygenase [Leptolyngbya sp. Heron Island J]|uniref:phytanoyl-CoA dioxygenase family protein n=1 Tax=Leptolyngbya sp. Heron Island J TaxID=1385935 RepID=UPI0003B9C32E|nr:phytanoyl-CoA dioxygenase family protein [Leptolyngbya sp. Heron Island J]ESA36907.1 phytanoyl- dioxygenase [Leptolyngbya sp. Heron Island J]
MDARTQFKHQGHTILKQFLGADEIQQITRIVNRIYEQWRAENYYALVEQQLINMHSLTHPQYFQGCGQERIEFFELIASVKLTHAMQHLFNTEIYFHNTQLFFNPHNNEKQPYWHRDLQYSPITDAVQEAEHNNMLSLHIRIPLVAEKGVELIPDTHNRWDTELEKNVRFELNGHSNSEALPDSVIIELHPGDILIFNAQMIHRGNYALNPTRKALDLCLGKPHPLVEGFLDPMGLPTDEEINHIHNRTWYDLARELAATQSKNKSAYL